MSKTLLGVLLWVAFSIAGLANCELREFRWLCELPVEAKLAASSPSTIDCGGTNVYVTREQYETIARNQRVGINMTMKVNGEYISSPCVPAGYHSRDR